MISIAWYNHGSIVDAGKLIASEATQTTGVKAKNYKILTEPWLAIQPCRSH